MRGLHFCLTSLLILVVCKPVQTGVAYTIQNAVTIRQEPTRKSERVVSLPMNTMIQITEFNVKDDEVGNKVFWYRVKYGEQRGYISYEEEIERKALMTFKDVQSKKEVGLVMASSLRVRKSPGLASRVLSIVPRGEIVSILMEGSFQIEIDNKFGTWVKVRTQKGDEGFVYAGYLERAADVDFLRDYAGLDDPEYINGFVCILAGDPRYYGNPMLKNAASFARGSSCGGHNFPDRLPKQGGCAEVTRKATVGGILYYKIEEPIGYVNECEGNAAGWIASDQVEFGENLYNLQTKNITDFNLRKFLDFAQASLTGSTLLAAGSQLSELKTNSIKQYVLLSSSVRHYGWTEPVTFLFTTENESINLIQSFNRHDLKGYNGAFYFLTESSVRASHYYSLYVLDDRGGKVLTELRTYGYGEEEDLVFDPPYITLLSENLTLSDTPQHPPFDHKFDGAVKRVLKIEGDRVVEVNPKSIQ